MSIGCRPQASGTFLSSGIAEADAWQKIEDLAQRVLRLTISRHDPEQFFVERSDIAAEMRRVARTVR